MFDVNGITWYLRLVDALDGNLRRSDNVITLGVTDNNLKSVFINKKLSPGMFDKVLCHELVHVFSFSYDLHIPIETEELIADFLSTYGRDIFTVADDIIKRFVEVA